MIIYCDGACRGNPGPGGWGVYVKTTGQELYDHSPYTTNNKMELMAAIHAVKLIENTGSIYTDSNYVIKGITEWMAGWKKNNWQTKKGPVKNKELWLELDSLIIGKNISWNWVKGHATDLDNKHADMLANLGADGKKSMGHLEHKESQKINEPPVVVPQFKESDIIENIHSSKRYYVLNNNMLMQPDNHRYYSLMLLDKEVVYIAEKIEELEKNYKLSDIKNEDRSVLLKVLNDTHYKSYNRMSEIVKMCHHEVQLVKDWEDRGANCKFCRRAFGWMCGLSPDHVCHYFTSEGEVELINGDVVDAPEDHDGQWETDDMCIYCGAPDERK